MRQKEREQQSINRNIALIISVIVVGVGILAFWELSRQVITDRLGCLIEPTKTSTSMAILLDASDTREPAQIREVTQVIYSMVNKLEPYDKVKLFLVDHDSYERDYSPVFVRCIPHPSDSSKGEVRSQLAQNQFKQLLANSIKKLDSNQPNSPIIRSIASVNSHFKKGKGAYRSTAIVIVSDLLEHSTLLSMYRQDWLENAERDKLKIAKARPRLDGVDVSFVLLLRPTEEAQNKDVVSWWHRFIMDSGANLRSQIPISGGY